jgi:allophanate hydrolase
VAVASGLVSFALGTDTAGSGRVPAAFNNLVGLKPTRGRLSTQGAVPACRSLDCISIFALTCADASAVLNVAAGFDADDDFSIPPDQIPSRPSRFGGSFRFGVPRPDQLRFFGNEDATGLYRQSENALRELGGIAVEIDFEPFALAGSLLYEGPWLAERLASTQEFMQKRPEALLPLTRQIIQAAGRFDAVSAFKGSYTLRALRRRSVEQWKKMDVLLLPTTGTIYTVAQVEAEPLKLNGNLGYYTNFVNLMDLTALAIPAGFTTKGLPLGVTLMAQAGYESALLHVGDQLHRKTSTSLGATYVPIPPMADFQTLEGEGTKVRLAVVGAHLSGQPLNHQLTSIGARLVRSCKTAPVYRLFALPNTKPAKPGLIRSENGQGSSIEIEVWEMSTEAFGGFVAAIPPPLGVGTIQLEDGEQVKSFLCESFAVQGGTDISHFGGWRGYLRGTSGA